MLLHAPYAQAQTNRTDLLCVKVWMKLINNISQLLTITKNKKEIFNRIVGKSTETFSELLKSIRNFFVCEKFTINSVPISMENSWIILLFTDCRHWDLLDNDVNTQHEKHNAKIFQSEMYNFFGKKICVSLRKEIKNLRTKNQPNTLRLMKNSS